jgi:hypothetical protein
MGQITVEERRRIRLNKQRASLEFIRQLSAPLPLSKPPATRPRFRWVWEIALIGVLLTASWFLAHVVELHPRGRSPTRPRASMHRIKTRTISDDTDVATAAPKLGFREACSLPPC